MYFGIFKVSSIPLPYQCDKYIVSRLRNESEAHTCIANCLDTVANGLHLKRGVQNIGKVTMVVP